MFDQLILEVIKSEGSCKNLLTDGKYTCTYGELAGIFAAFDLFFSDAHISAGECCILVCGNSLPEALVLLWMLYRKRDVFLLPRGGPVFNLPQFCKHKVNVDLSAPGPDIYVPAAYLTIETNPDFGVEASVPGEGGSIFLRTSGSTADPKLVMHAHEKFAGNAVNCVERFEISYRDRVLIPVPIYHMYGLGAGFLPGIIAGASINLLEKTNIIKYLDREKQYRPNVSYLTPPLCQMFLNTRKSSYHYRLVVTAGDRINKTTFESFEKRFGQLVNLYGSTELGAIATSKLSDPLDLRSNGIIESLPGVRIDLAAKNGDKEKGVSEIICRHDYGFEVYIDKKGGQIARESGDWFRTKDLGKRMGSKSNRFKVIGRTGNSINRNGILVAFSEVESIMEQGIKEIAHVVVLAGDEANYRGKKMTAYCELKPGIETDNENIRSQCFHLMMRHMVPDEVIIMKEIPRLPNGKFDRKKLIERRKNA